jgi:L-iditol 2-dehydrogenase
MVFETPVVPLSAFETQYDPTKVLKHPEFRVLAPNDPAVGNKKANIACAYNPAHEVHLIHKPVPVAGRGEVVVHVRATGICG